MEANSVTFTQPLIESVVGCLLHSLWIGGLACVGAWLSMIGLRPATAQLRCNVLLLWLVAIPLAAVGVEYWFSNTAATSQRSSSLASTTDTSFVPTPLRVTPQSNASQSNAPHINELGETAGVASPGSTPTNPASDLDARYPNGTMASQPAAAATGPDPQPAPPARWESTRHAIIVTIFWSWLAGVVLLWGKLLGDWMQLRRWVGRSLPADVRLAERVAALTNRLRLGREVQVRLIEQVAVPMTVGVLRPLLLVPTSCLTLLSPSEFEAILIHELAHVRRFDFLINLIQRLLETLFFFHPGVWWLGKHIRQEREYACDDIAIRISANRVEYARGLASLARLTAYTGLGLSATAHPLKARIQRIVGNGSLAPAPSLPSSAVVLIGGMLGLLLWGVAPRVDATDELAATNPRVVAARAPVVPAPVVPAPVVPAPVVLAPVVLAPVALAPVARAPVPAALAKLQTHASTTLLAVDSAIENRSTAPIQGIVVGSSGAPLSDVSVVLRSRYHRGDLPNLATTNTNSGGHFEFEPGALDALAKESSDFRRQFPLEVIARKRGHSIRWLQLTSTRRDIQLQLRSATRFAGRVLDETGAPVPRAVVRVTKIMSLNALTTTDDFQHSSTYRHGASFLDLSGAHHQLTATVNDDGYFEFDELPSRVGFEFTVDHEQLVRQSFFAATTSELLDPRAEYTDPQTNARLPIVIHRDGGELRIDRSVSIRLVLTDERSGEPLEDVVVRRLVGSEEQTSGSDGIVEFHRIPRASIRGWSVNIIPPADSQWLAGQVINQQQAPENLKIEHKVRMSVGRTLAGRVVDEATGEGIAQATLFWSSPRYQLSGDEKYVFSPGWRQVQSGSEGRFQVVIPTALESAGVLTLWRSPAGYEKTPWEIDRQNRLVTTSAGTFALHAATDTEPYGIDLSALKPGEEPQFQIKRLPSVLFRFVDPQGEPLAVTISARTVRGVFGGGELPVVVSRDAPPRPVALSVKSTNHEVAADEAFDASVLLYGAAEEPDAFQLLIVSQDQSHGAYFSATSLQSSSSQTTITLEPLGTISGVVVDRDSGLPVEGAAIYLSVAFNASHGQVLYRTFTDERGQYTFERLIPGMRYTVQIKPDVNAPQTTATEFIAQPRADEHIRHETTLPQTATVTQ